jgi:hypothetical protein
MEAASRYRPCDEEDIKDFVTWLIHRARNDINGKKGKLVALYDWLGVAGLHRNVQTLSKIIQLQV